MRLPLPAKPFLEPVGLYLGWMILACATATAAPVTNLLNLQFGVDASIVKVGPAAYGLSGNDVWNLYSRDDGQGGFRSTGSLTNLVWSDGSSLPATLIVDNAPGAWSNGHPDPMFGLYLYPFNGAPIRLALLNLPPGIYDVLAYGHGGPPDVQNTLFEVQSGGIDHGSGRTSTRPGWNSTNWQENVQYVRFGAVSVFEGQPLTLLSRADAIPQAAINGLQLVRLDDVPVGKPVDPIPTNPPPVITNLPPVITAAGGGLLNVQFGTDGALLKEGPAAIGQGTNDFWNRYSRDLPGGGFRNVGSIPKLHWANGEESGASLTIENAAGAWPNGNPDPMFGIFLYPLSGNPVITVTITQLPPGTYSVYAYGHGGPPDNHNTVFELISGGVSLGDRATPSVPGWNHTNWTEGQQYVVYHDVLVDAASPLILRAKPGAHVFGMINGLQILRHGPVSVRFFPEGGLFTNSTHVQITGAGPGREVRYTLDGSVPTLGSTLYSRPIALNASALIQAQAFSNGVPTGDRVSATFQRVYALNDGIHADWRRLYFGEGYATDPRAAAEADPDGDGSSNLQEFTAGTNPTDVSSGFLVRNRLVPSISWRSEPGKTYRILRKSQLSDALWTPVKEITATAPFSRFTDEDVENADSYYAVEPLP
jgi:hypothetical protein